MLAAPDAPAQLVELREPERSAPSISITVALATSIPTSITLVATSTCGLPRGEALHRRLLLARGHLAVQQPDLEVAELAGAQPFGLLGGRLCLELLASGVATIALAPSTSGQTT